MNSRQFHEDYESGKIFASWCVSDIHAGEMPKIFRALDASRETQLDWVSQMQTGEFGGVYQYVERADGNHGPYPSFASFIQVTRKEIQDFLRRREAYLNLLDLGVSHEKALDALYGSP